MSKQILYNFQTREMKASQFRTGHPPAFAQGEGLHGTLTNQTYAATNAFITTDDVANPIFKVRAKYIKIVPGKKMTARNAILYAAGVPVFYFPFYSRNLGEHANNFNFVPGYRSISGPYLLTSYTFWLSQQLDGLILHMDERTRRGPGVGPTLNYHLGRWGDGSFKYYYLYDGDTSVSATNGSIPHNRQRVNFSYLATPVTNLEIRAVARYRETATSSANSLRANIARIRSPIPTSKPTSFGATSASTPTPSRASTTSWKRSSACPKSGSPAIAGEWATLPSITRAKPRPATIAGSSSRPTPFPTARISAPAARTLVHQLLLPETFFGWLNVTPRVGGRYTWYSAATGPGATTGEKSRGVLNTGIEFAFRASRL